MSAMEPKNIPFPTQLFPDVCSSQSRAESQASRLRHLTASFVSLYGHPPHFFTRAPGRVNIIGEHIDYCGFSVLPAAIEPDLILACAATYAPSPSSSSTNPVALPVTVTLSNLDPSYTSHQFRYTSSPVSVPICSNGGWVNYVKASLRTVLEKTDVSSVPDDRGILSSISILFNGSLPQSSGLSSSAAITTASVLTFLNILSSSSEKTFDKTIVAELAIESERLCGINVGGMDQSASVFGEPLKLLHIEFIPSIDVTPIIFPKKPESTFVIANSLIKSTKLSNLKFQYNLRVIECRIGTHLLVNHLLPKNSNSNNIKSLRDLIDCIIKINQNDQKKVSILEAIESVLKVVLEKGIVGNEDGLSKKQVLEKLGLNDDDEFEKVIGRGIEAEPINERYKIFNRLRHVLTESKRVYQYKSILLTHSNPEEDSKLSEKEQETKCKTKLEELGKLMTESHESCQKDYECSCPELDELVSIGMRNGSLGSRLTGAGWGGSTVHLVPDVRLEQFIKQLKVEYYAQKFPLLNDKEVEMACFASKPGGGACILDASHFI